MSTPDMAGVDESCQKALDFLEKGLENRLRLGKYGIWAEFSSGEVQESPVISILFGPKILR